MRKTNAAAEKQAFLLLSMVDELISNIMKVPGENKCEHPWVHLAIQRERNLPLL